MVAVQILFSYCQYRRLNKFIEGKFNLASIEAILSHLFQSLFDIFYIQAKLLDRIKDRELSCKSYCFVFRSRNKD